MHHLPTSFIASTPIFNINRLFMQGRGGDLYQIYCSMSYLKSYDIIKFMTQDTRAKSQPKSQDGEYHGCSSCCWMSLSRWDGSRRLRCLISKRGPDVSSLVSRNLCVLSQAMVRFSISAPFNPWALFLLSAISLRC